MAFKADRLTIYVYIAKAMDLIQVEHKMWSFFLDRAVIGTLPIETGPGPADNKLLKTMTALFRLKTSHPLA